MISKSEQKRLNLKLAWAKYRMDMLERIEEKRKEAKEIEKKMESRNLTENMEQDLRRRLQMLLLEAEELDHKSKSCWAELSE